MSAPTGTEQPPIPPKERSPSPDDDLLREEPLESEVPITQKPSATTTTNQASTTTTTTATAQTLEENPPAKPPRPVSQFEQNVATLAEAFPDTDVAVIKAVLTASGGRVEPAFNALLGMSDPSAAAEMEIPPPQPPRPRGQRDYPAETRHYPTAHDDPNYKTSTSTSQLEADELYARQLAEHYGGVAPPRGARQGRGGIGNYPASHGTNRQSDEGREEDREHSFFDDELPVIRENLKKGFLETQSKVNKFIQDFSKKISGEEETDQHSDHQQQQQHPLSASSRQGASQQYPQRYSSRKSGDAYDADPTVLQDDFSHLELRDKSAEGDQPRRNRPIANPNLFTSSNNPSQQNPRKVAFTNQSEEDLYRRSPVSRTGGMGDQLPSAMRTVPTANNAPGGNTGNTTGSKWAPLAAVDPTPLNNDPFSLADSDDEHDAPTSKTGPQESGTKVPKP